jgi:hypothetical protein
MNTSFQVTFDPAATGVHQATISIGNDDADENPYVFVVQGEGYVEIDEYVEPEFPDCPAEYELIGHYGGGDDSGLLRRDKPPTSRTYVFDVPDGYTANLWLEGWAREGHPELGCPASGHPHCSQDQDNESFNVFVGVPQQLMGTYADQGASVHDWFPVGSWTAIVGAGSQPLTFAHTMEGSGPGSVDYKVSFCAQMIEVSNQAPAVVVDGLVSASVPINEGEELVVTVSATDPDGDPLTWDITPLPLPAFINITQVGDMVTITLSPGSGDQGDYPFTVSISDGTDTVMVNFTLTVVDVP